MTVTVRLYRPADAAAISELFHRSVEGVAARVYGPEQIAAWTARGPDEAGTHARCSDGRTVLVAVEGEERVVAFTDLEPDGHIHMLFCSPEVEGRGVAHALQAELERVARAAGHTRLFVEASEQARRFYLRQGFVVLHRRDFTIGDDVPIHNFAMEKRLATPAMSGPKPA